MYPLIENRIRHLPKELSQLLISGGAIGLEKECLRVSPNGDISQRPHPAALGAALTHPYITTDYSEALSELITPPCREVGEVLSFLSDIQKYVCDQLDDELLWAASMPCVLAGGENIPIADYGSSNEGLMKTIYRRGLGHRYGRTMQVIAGVHFNFSLDQAFWPLYRSFEQRSEPLREFTDAAYFGLIRNLQRFGWLIPYLFGASPAVCKSFLAGEPTTLLKFDETTYYETYATSLRMGDIGYTNSKEEGVGIKANYDSLAAYVKSLTCAIETPSAQWEAIGVKVNGRYEQLSTHILQIENEYYSTVRPKQLLEGMEKPTLALGRRGVCYIELRSLDVDVFHPLGVGEDQLRFLRALMIFCLLHDSPRISRCERREIDANIFATAHQGRDPALELHRRGESIRLKRWATALCQALLPVCEMLDGNDPDRPYSQSLQRQMEAVRDPECTPSARILAEMRERGEGFFDFAKRMSQQHSDYFSQRRLSEQRRKQFQQWARESVQQQAAMESARSVSLGRFLADYFAQK